MVVHVSGCDDGYNPRDLEVSLEDVSMNSWLYLNEISILEKHH